VVPEPAESILTEGSIRAVTGPEVARNVLIRRATVDDVVPMGTLWLRAALAGYEGMFPPEAPKPTAAAPLSPGFVIGPADDIAEDADRLLELTVGQIGRGAESQGPAPRVGADAAVPQAHL
jgi:hypothetical protein